MEKDTAVLVFAELEGATYSPPLEEGEPESERTYYPKFAVRLDAGVNTYGERDRYRVRAVISDDAPMAVQRDALRTLYEQAEKHRLDVMVANDGIELR